MAFGSGVSGLVGGHRVLLQHRHLTNQRTVLGKIVL